MCWKLHFVAHAILALLLFEGTEGIKHVKEGNVQCWGSDATDQTPDIPAGLGNALLITGGNRFACSKWDSGILSCWGRDAENTGVLTVPSGLIASEVVSMAAGLVHMCVLLESGKVVCWGKDTMVNVPSGLTDQVSLAAGAHATCSSGRLGDVTCWGTTAGTGYEQFGNPIDQVFVGNAGGSGIVCGREEHGGAVLCFKNSGDTGTWGAEEVPSGLALPIKDFVTGSYFSCAIDATDTVTCWGASWPPSVTTPNPNIQKPKALFTHASGTFACALEEESTGGATHCWGTYDITLPGPFFTVAFGQHFACGLLPYNTTTVTATTSTTATSTSTSSTTASMTATHSSTSGTTSSVTGTDTSSSSTSNSVTSTSVSVTSTSASVTSTSTSVTSTSTSVTSTSTSVTSTSTSVTSTSTSVTSATTSSTRTSSLTSTSASSTSTSSRSTSASSTTSLSTSTATSVKSEVSSTSSFSRPGSTEAGDEKTGMLDQDTTSEERPADVFASTTLPFLSATSGQPVPPVSETRSQSTAAFLASTRAEPASWTSSTDTMKASSTPDLGMGSQIATTSAQVASQESSSATSGPELGTSTAQPTILKTGLPLLLAQLNGSTLDEVTTVLPGGKQLTARRLDLRGSASIIKVSVAGVAVSLPKEALASAPPSSIPGDTMALVVGSGGTIAAGLDLQGATMLDALEIQINYISSGDGVAIAAGNNPVTFGFPNVMYSDSMQDDSATKTVCKFYDPALKAWSNEGTGTSKSNVPGQPLQCWTTHFTLFAAFVQTFACSQFHLLNAEAVGMLFKGDWHSRFGTRVFWGVLLLLLVSFLISCVMDWRRSKVVSWRDSFFLIPLYKGPNRASRTSNSGSLDRIPSPSNGARVVRLSSLQRAALCCGVFEGYCSCDSIKESSALRDAIDDIISNWVDNFSELRSFAEGMMSGLELSSLSWGKLVAILHNMMCSISLMASRRMTGATMMLSDDVISFVLEDKNLFQAMVAQGDSPETPEDACDQDFMQRASGQWVVARTRKEVWTALHNEITENVQQHIRMQKLWWYYPLAMVQLFFIQTPFGQMWVLDIFMSCKMRAFLCACEVVGAFLLCSLFFNASGGVRKVGSDGTGTFDDPCTPDSGVGYKVGRVIAIALGSVVVAGLPIGFLRSLHTRSFKRLEYEGCPEWDRQLCSWKMQDKMVWTLGSIYLAFGAFFIHVFLANIDVVSHGDFAQGGVIAVLQDFVLLPAALAILAPSLARFLLFLTGVLSRQRQDALLGDVFSSFSSRLSQDMRTLRERTSQRISHLSNRGSLVSTTIYEI